MPTPQEIYRGLLKPACTVTLVSSSRKKMMDGKYPTKALVKKAATTKGCQDAPTPQKKTVKKRIDPPRAKTPSPPRKLNLPVLPRKTDAQKKTAAMMDNLFARVQNKKVSKK